MLLLRKYFCLGFTNIEPRVQESSKKGSRKFNTSSKDCTDLVFSNSRIISGRYSVTSRLKPLQDGNRKSTLLKNYISFVKEGVLPSVQGSTNMISRKPPTKSRNLKNKLFHITRIDGETHLKTYVSSS